MASYYDILGVPPSASQDDITAAFRARALESHPDVAGHESAGAFRALADAYAVLRDPVTRRRYDALQAGGFPGVAGGGFAAGGGPASTSTSSTSSSDPWEDHFRRFWEAQGFGGAAPDGRTREQARAAAAAAAAEEWEREKAGARAARAAFARRRARTVEARAARHGAVLRGFWQAKPGVGWADGAAAAALVASLAGIAWLAGQPVRGGRGQAEDKAGVDE